MNSRRENPGGMPKAAGWWLGDFRRIRCLFCGQVRLGSPCEGCKLEFDSELGYSPYYDEPARTSVSAVKAGTIIGWLAPLLHNLEKVQVMEEERRSIRAACERERKQERERERASRAWGFAIARAWWGSAAPEDDDIWI